MGNVSGRTVLLVLGPLCLWVLVSSGCSTVGRDDRHFPVTLAAAWEATCAAVEARRLTLTSKDEESGTIATDYRVFASRMTIMDKYLTRPSSLLNPLTLYRRAHYRLDIRVKAVDPESSLVEISCWLEAQDMKTKRWRACTSKGLLERKFLDEVGERLGITDDEGS